MSSAEEDWTLIVKKLLAEKLDPIDKRLSNVEQSLHSSNREQGETEAPVYKCKGEKCGFATDDIDHFVEHKIEEGTKQIRETLASLPKPSAAQAEQNPPAPKRHQTVSEWLDCPECAPKFEVELLKRGWKKPAPAKRREGVI